MASVAAPPFFLGRRRCWPALVSYLILLRKKQIAFKQEVGFSL